MTFKNGAAQIIKLLPTLLTLISLPMGLMGMKTTFLDRTRPTGWTAYSVWPAQFSNHRKAFCVVYQVLEVDHASILSELIHLLEIT
jgi:hypothetical protein